MAKYLTATDVAEALGVTHETVRRWAAAGAIAYIRLPSGQIRFRQEDLDAIVAGVPRTDDDEAVG
jgi:excisionase family DNA binding protein